MKRKLLLVACITFVLSSYSLSLFAQTFPTIYATLSSGSWATLTTWESFSGNATNTPGSVGTGTAAAIVPSGTHFVYIRSGHTITMGSANRGCLGMMVENGAALLAGETTARRLQIATGGTGFTTPQSWSVTNNGIIGGATDGIYFEPSTYSATITLTGSGNYTIGRIRMPGGLAGSGNGVVSIIIDQNMTITQSANYALTAVYNPTATDNYTITINAGKTVTLATGTGYFHNGSTSATVAGNYIYNINGTLDLSGTSGNVNLTPLGSAASVITLNVNGTVKLGSGALNCDTSGGGATPVYGKIALNINNGGLLDATAATSTFKTGTQLGQYFVVAGTGTLKRNVASTATLFPIGTSSTSYSPVTLTNTGTADNFSVTLKNTFTNTPPTPTQVVNKQWTITEQGTGAIATASFGWATADHASAFNPANSVAVMNYVGSAWVNYALSGALTGTGTVTDPYIAACAKNFTTFGNFGVTNGTGLPVSFASISAVKSVIGTDVSWSIATEVNTDKYVVEKSTDSRSFSAIGAVTATNAGKYSFADLSVNNGTSFYRIKAIDKDGTFQYSTVVSINSTNATASVQVYPNPVNNGNLNVQLSNLNKGNYSISVYNTIGQIIYTKNIVCNNLNTVLSIALPTSVKAGTYNLKITDGTTSITKTISVQ